MILQRLSEIALKRARNDFHNLILMRTILESCCDYSNLGISCTESVAVIGLIPHQLTGEALVRGVLLPVERSLSNSLASRHECPLLTEVCSQ